MDLAPKLLFWMIPRGRTCGRRLPPPQTSRMAKHIHSIREPLGRHERRRSRPLRRLWTPYLCGSYLGWRCIDSSWLGVHGDLHGSKNRTPEDDQKLKNLVQNLATLKFVSTPELEVLCSATYRPHLKEPFHIGLRPAPKSLSPGEILRLIKYWRRQSRREERRKNFEYLGSSSGRSPTG